jgi:hypothetical protein
MKDDVRMAHFIMLGQTASRTVRALREVAPPETLLLSSSYDIGPLMPEAVKSALRAAEAYKLFFVFETYLREFVVDVLSKDPLVNWWDRLSKPIQDEVKKLEDTEEAKAWMAVGSRDKSALLTFPQLLAAIDENWKASFEEVVRDKTLIQSARAISHLRNTICHMSEIPEEEFGRVRQTMRDWFRMVAP